MLFFFLVFFLMKNVYWNFFFKVTTMLNNFHAIFLFLQKSESKEFCYHVSLLPIDIGDKLKPTEAVTIESMTARLLKYRNS